jgi:hypothetical protein
MSCSSSNVPTPRWVQDEYKKGISAWNFDVTALKAQVQRLSGPLWLSHGGPMCCSRMGSQLGPEPLNPQPLVVSKLKTLKL